MLPLSLVMSASFRKFVSILDPLYTLPSRKHISSKLLPQKQAEVEAKTKAILQESNNVSVMLDMWSNCQMKGFLGITGHFIDHDWSMQSVMLG
jgi:hypothetical protein